MSDQNAICKGCGQPYWAHLGEEKVCPWPIDEMKPTTDYDPWSSPTETEDE